VMETTQVWATDIRRTRHIGDFRGWENRNSYRQAFTRLLRDLEVDVSGNREEGDAQNSKQSITESQNIKEDLLPKASPLSTRGNHTTLPKKRNRLVAFGVFAIIVLVISSIIISNLHLYFPFQTQNKPSNATIPTRTSTPTISGNDLFHLYPLSRTPD